MDHKLPPTALWQPILAAYAASLQPHHVEYLNGAGGFSGAEFWRLETPAGTLCLRRWPPEHPKIDRLTLIHQVLRHAASRGVDFLPVPLKTRSGETFVGHAERLWELAPWLPGEGNYLREPCPEKICAAMVALARFHQATADFPAPACRLAPSPGISARVDQLRDWTPSELARLRSAIAGGRIANPSFIEVIALFEQLAPQVERELAAARHITAQLQPVIRDVWADHFLFTSCKVTGLVDFGGMNIDSPATDIARLLGSMAGDDQALWKTGLTAYESIRPLFAREREFIGIFDRSTVALSGMNWLRWIYFDGRTFADGPAIAARLAIIAERMRSALKQARR